MKKSILALLLSLTLILSFVPINASAVKPNYLTFTAEAENSSVTFNYGVGYNVKYSTDGGANWSNYVCGTKIDLANVNDKVSFKANGVYTSTSSHFEMEGKIAASGSVTSLTDGDGFDVSLADKDACYSGMFMNCTALTSAPELPSTTLGTSCYNHMFSGCTSLTAAPDLPATTLAEHCYNCMFSGCTSLKYGPATLPTATLKDYCYYCMFYNCINLETIPAITITSTAPYCCHGMFHGCAKLTTTPTLSATTLSTNCYAYMFQGCSSLATAPSLPAETMAVNCYQCMFKNCSALQNAPALPGTTLATNCYREMFAGCTSIKTAPTLSAAVMAEYCYASMFSNCSALTNIPTLSSTSLAEGCYAYMFSDCTSLTKPLNLSATVLAKSCYEGMFYNCSKIKVYSANGITTWSIPSTATTAENFGDDMFAGTGGTFTGNPVIGTTYYLDQKPSVANATIASISKQTYTSFPIVPALTVKYGTKTLTLGTDYTVSYSNNINVGKATVVITGKGNYVGTNSTTFTIAPAPLVIKADSLVSIANQELLPLTYIASGLLGTDKISGELATNADKDVVGTYDITQGTLKASSNYAISYTKGTYTVKAIDFSDAVISEIPDETYTGSEITPKITVTLGDKTLVKNRDYTVDYSENVNAGIATVTVTAKGNYDGIKIAKFNILPKEVNVVAESKESYVGQDLLELTYTADELIGEDTYTGNIITTAKNDEAGKYLILQGELTAGDNYKINFTNATYTVKDKELKVVDNSKLEVVKADVDSLNKTLVALKDSTGTSFADSVKTSERLVLELKVDKDTVLDNDKLLIENIANRDNFEFFNVVLLLYIDDADPIDVGDENTELIKLVYKFDFANKGNVEVYRVHDGVSSKLSTTPNNDGEYIELNKTAGTITICASKYSTYAVAYDTVKETQEIVNTGDNDTYLSVATTAVVSALALLATRKKEEEY